MKKWLLILFVLSTAAVHANDGAFYSSGGTLVPIKETTIRMKKEVLTLTAKASWMQVDVYFEFYNPGPARELTVGFVTPPAQGDVTEEDENHPQISEFMVMVGNVLLPYKIARMKDSGFKPAANNEAEHDFVYYFKVTFGNGVTMIRHSYQYKGGGSVEATSDYFYRLTTGTGWAGGTIEDFELNIIMAEDSFFGVPANFENKAADWIIAGIGRIGKPRKSHHDELEAGRNEPGLRMVYIRKGLLQLRTRNFKPVSDLSITEFMLHNEIGLWSDSEADNVFLPYIGARYSDSVAYFISHLSDDDLRLYRNLHYARKGYDFKDSVLKKKFLQYIWYIPDPTVKTDTVREYYFDREVLQLIAEEVKRRQLKPGAS